MDLEGNKIGDLAAGEARPQQVPRVLPGRAIGGEDALTQQGRKGRLSAIWQMPTLEVGSQYGFHIVRLNSEENIVHGEFDMKSVPMSKKPSSPVLEQFALFDGAFVGCELGPSER